MVDFTITYISRELELIRHFTISEEITTKDGKYIPYDVTVMNKRVISCVKVSQSSLCSCCIYKGFCGLIK
jgi:hypothetical protein